MLRRLILSITALGLLAGTVPSVAVAGESQKDLIQTARKARTFTTLIKAVRIAGLTETLRTGGPFTVFAPTDEAFAKLPPETLRAVLADRELLRSILLYHVVDGAVYAKDVVGLTSAPTLNGATVSIAVQGGGVVLNGNTSVTSTDVAASNGVIHVVDTVLMPPTN
jgi:uncharacterized surface protein with fasciclin (FAS1) repeats